MPLYPPQKVITQHSPVIILNFICYFNIPTIYLNVPSLSQYYYSRI